MSMLPATSRVRTVTNVLPGNLMNDPVACRVSLADSPLRCRDFHIMAKRHSREEGRRPSSLQHPPAAGWLHGGGVPSAPPTLALPASGLVCFLPPSEPPPSLFGSDAIKNARLGGVAESPAWSVPD